MRGSPGCSRKGPAAGYSGQGGQPARVFQKMSAGDGGFDHQLLLLKKLEYRLIIHLGVLLGITISVVASLVKIL